MRTRKRMRELDSNSAAARARACEREPGLNTTSRTPRRTNSSRRAAAKEDAGELFLGRVIVEFGEFLLQTTNSFVLLLVTTEVLEKIGVVVWRHLARNVAAVAAVLAEEEPQGRADDGQENDDDPGRLVECPHPSSIGEDHVDGGEDRQRNTDHPENEEQSWSHAVNLRLDAAYTCVVKPWLLYSVIRVGLFAAVLALLLLAGIEGWLAALIAAIIGLCVSYLFLGRQREAVSTTVYDRRSGRTSAPTDDEDVEDALENRSYLGRNDLEGDGPAQR
jgi:hypothetical protein